MDSKNEVDSSQEKQFPSTVTQPRRQELKSFHNSHGGSISNRPGSEAASPIGDSSLGSLGRRQTVVTVTALCLSVFLAALDVTIITTPLPTIAAEFHASEKGYVWIGSSFILATAASSPIWGKFSDIWGRKAMLILANMFFLAGSLISALSVNLETLITGRTIQGIGSGGIMVMANTCVGDLFNVRQRPIYFGLFGLIWAVASAIGPVIGGVFTEKATWRWCFYINLPVDGVALIMLVFFFKLKTPRMSLWLGLHAVDWIGVLTITSGTVIFLLGLEFGGTDYPWLSPAVICLVAFGVILIGLFVLYEWKYARQPLIPVRIFRNWSVVAVFAITFIHGATFIAGSYFLPLYFQTALAKTPISSGVYLLPYAVSLSIASSLTGLFIRKTARYVDAIQFGMVAMTLGFGLFIDLKPYESWPRLAIYQIIAGLGGGPNFEAPLIALYAIVDHQEMASTTSTFGFVRQMSQAVSIVIGGVIFQSGMKSRRSSLVDILGSDAATKQISASASTLTAFDDALSESDRARLSGVYTKSFATVWIFYAVFSGIGTIISVFVKRHRLESADRPPEASSEAQFC
ncbi:hypothetical protein FE257_011419 [Aspergillus nanangensis]|uniref:Efflux pump dotC n=1 Tax=Aspergillus nanangensis TaxID=2582783 RepID=A0AAD4GRF9_ASPNN|nr:hypothetical protein FE257_011419 [Aspergillus nanangensis]